MNNTTTRETLTLTKSQVCEILYRSLPGYKLILDIMCEKQTPSALTYKLIIQRLSDKKYFASLHTRKFAWNNELFEAMETDRLSHEFTEVFESYKSVPFYL